MRREKGLGATLCVVTDPAWRPVAERLRAERAWALTTELGAEDAIAAAFPEALGRRRHLERPAT